MKRWFPLLLAGFSGLVCTAAGAQAVPSEGPAQPGPQTIEMQQDGRCPVVHPGDTVHFSLTIEGVASARAVFADLQLRSGHAAYRETDLPMPGAGDMGGGGAGVREASSDRVYHFAFTVAPGVSSGVYRGAGVAVTANFGSADKGVEAELNRRARDQVRRFCLSVMGTMENQPVVTEFHPEGVDRK